MPSIITHPEWRDALGPCKYPFADTADLSNASGNFIPENVFADASFYVIGARERLYISEIVITADTCELHVSDATRKEVAIGSFDLLSPPETIQFVDLHGRPAGVLVGGELPLFQSWVVGSYAFQLGHTEFAASCVIPTPEVGLRGFLLDDGSLLSSDVWLVGEGGVVLSYVHAEIEAGCQAPGEFPTIRVDIVGDPLYRRKQCDPIELFTTPRFLQKLRLKRGCETYDLVPDDNGDVKITNGSHQASDTILRIRTTPEGLVFETVGNTE